MFSDKRMLESILSLTHVDKKRKRKNLTVVKVKNKKRSV